jgi:hypothetical protein
MDPRPRDALGRPLPRDASPEVVVAGIDETALRTDDTAWGEAIAYLEAGRPFHAHEVFEARWRRAPRSERDAWRGLAQWGAALTHAARGNPVGAARLAARAMRTIEEAPTVPSCIDLERVHDSCMELVAAGPASG